jgi:HTH-type transcriptional regulator / antitoxin HigA
MTNQPRNAYVPDTVTPPGATLGDALDALGMSQADLSARTGLSKQIINEIVQGKAPITPKTALMLETVLGVPARFWNARERNYRESLAQQAETEALEQHIAWARAFPYLDMKRFGWVPDVTGVERVRELLRFFGIASPQQWEEIWRGAAVAFRKSPVFEASPYATAAWLRRGEVIAQNMPMEEYTAPTFRAVLNDLRSLSRDEPSRYLIAVRERCATAGVAVVYVPTLTGTHASGAAYWLTPSRAVIQMSFRYKCDDQYWFTLYHEAFHLLKHGKRQTFIEEKGGADTAQEREANAFAAEALIPEDAYRTFIGAGSRRTKEQIIAFANEIGVAPGIVVGRMQFDKVLPHDWCNDLKKPIDFRENDLVGASSR